MSPRPRDDPRSVRDSLAAVARDLGMPEPAVLGALHERWSEIAGEQMSRHARPRSLLDGVLTVAVEDPAWATQIRYLEDELRARSSEMLGEGLVKTVRVVVERPGPPP